MGKTVRTAEHRLKGHLRTAREGRTHVSTWIRSLDEPPVVRVLEECPRDELNERERYWIAKLKADGAKLCNHTEGGDGGASDRGPWNKGIPQTPEVKAKLAAAHRGLKASPETRAKMRVSRAKRPPASAETRARMAAARRAFWANKTPEERAEIARKRWKP